MTRDVIAPHKAAVTALQDDLESVKQDIDKLKDRLAEKEAERDDTAEAILLENKALAALRKAGLPEGA
jgi:predicted  nucleic acid-binding Zn-ribbon protein